jgi:hypothetical protein
MLCLAAVARADRVEWSDGRNWEGTVELGQQAKLRFHDGQRVREWDKAEIAAMRWRPVTQRMERAWQFIEAGQTAKRFTGGEYPTEELDATVTLVSGERITGHLLTTVLYLTAAGQTDKLVIKHKLSGKEGEPFAAIVFPTEVVFEQAGMTPATSGPLEVALAGAGKGIGLAAVGRTGMSAGRIKALGGGRFQVSVDGGDVIWGVQTANRIAVGWRGTAPDAARVRIEQGLRDLRDFFDDRRLVAVTVDPNDPTTAWSLLLLTRAGRTTLSGSATQPWRLEVWKWRLGEAADDLTAASRVVLFRGIRSQQSPLPDVRLDAVLAAFDRVEAGMNLKVAE